MAMTCGEPGSPGPGPRMTERGGCHSRCRAGIQCSIPSSRAECGDPHLVSQGDYRLGPGDPVFGCLDSRLRGNDKKGCGNDKEEGRGQDKREGGGNGKEGRGRAKRTIKKGQGIPWPFRSSSKRRLRGSVFSCCSRLPSGLLFLFLI